jgi:rubrerythrin
VRAASVLAVLLGWAAALSCPSIHAEEGTGRYPKTIAELKAAYSDEMEARQRYLAFAEQANREGFPNLSYLFVSLSVSESIHARNYGKAIEGMGIPVPAHSAWGGKSSTTKKNLQAATESEIGEIEEKYPGILERIRAENHEETIRYVRFAWESEKQHRDFLGKLQSGTGAFFPILVRRIEGIPLTFFVCRTCGSTVKQVPPVRCPVCEGESSRYERVERIP